MQINIIAVKELIEKEYRGNQRWFSEEIGVNEGYLSSILNNKRKPTSPKVIDGIVNLCKKKKWNCKKYIIFLY